MEGKLEMIEKFLGIRKFKGAMLWDNSQKGNYFSYIYQLDGKHWRIQYGKDINSIGRII